MNLFKYYDDSKFNLVFKPNGLSIRLSQISSLNDPFESRIDIKTALEKKAKKFIAAIKKSKLNQSDKKNNIDSIQISLNEALINTEEGFMYSLESFGILSLTKKHKNKLMWSHYTNSYKGFCIELDIGYIENELCHMKTPYSNIILPVEYIEERIIYDEKIINKTAKEQLEFMRYVMSSKDAIWSYEEEVRVIASLQKHPPSGMVGNTPLHTISIPASSIKQIIFGTFCDSKNIQFVQNWLQLQNAEHVKLSRIALDYKGYDLQTTPI